MSEPLWDFEPFVAAMRGRPTVTSSAPITGISIDSRTIDPGDAFFAIRGDQFDGHDYVGPASAKGAAAAVIAEERLPALGRLKLPFVVVGDVLQALELLGRAARARSSAQIAAVTGSVGKTTTKEMLALALAGSGRTHYSPASFNNHWGVPLTLARMPRAAAFGVFEIGMNHAGEIATLVDQVRPHVAIITTIELAHAEFFEDGIHGITRAKAEIFTGVEPGGAVILNRDNPQFEPLALKAIDAGIDRVYGFGENADAEARLTALDLLPDRSRGRVDLMGREVEFQVGAPGRHLVQNALAVLLAVSLMDGDVHAAVDALATMGAPRGRGERRTLHLAGGEATLIDESYNANPTSMRAAISVLAGARPAEPSGRRIAVLGDMLELGPEAEELHAGLAAPLVEAEVDRVYLSGPMMRALFEALPSTMQGHYAETSSELEPILAEDLRPGDVVMIKGSKGSRMAPLVEALQSRFPPLVEAETPDIRGPA